MIHIVFQEADVDVLRASFKLDPTLAAEIIQIKDDFAVGPLDNIYSKEGIQSRREWWRTILSGGDYDGKVDSYDIQDEKTIKEIIHTLSENQLEVIWIWVAQNNHDVCGYYWLVSQLKEFQGRVFILFLNNLPFISEKGTIFYPSNIFEIPPREFLKAKKLAREITLSEFEVDPDEWLRLCNENQGIRILEGAKQLKQYDYDYYDVELMKFITPDWQKVSRLFHTFYTRSKITTGDAYLLLRLKQLISEKKVDAQGVIRNIKEFEVKKSTL